MVTQAGRQRGLVLPPITAFFFFFLVFSPLLMFYCDLHFTDNWAEAFLVPLYLRNARLQPMQVPE